MSISREIWRRASPSNKRLFLGLRRRAPIAAVAAVFGAFAVCVPWANAVNGFRERRAERAALAPLLAEARRDSLTFPQVVVTNPAHLGKVVYWEVTVQTSTSSYAEGYPNRSVFWTNPDRVRDDMLWGQTRVLARVAAVSDDVVYLDYLGRP